MKNLMMLLLVLTTSVFATQLQAQTAKCTAAQKEACKKICADKTACTPAQQADCAKACTAKKGTATAAVKVNQSPEKANTNANAGNASVAKLVGLVEIGNKTEEKKTTCNKPCTGKKKE